jgi:hypothetical protein
VSPRVTAVIDKPSATAPARPRSRWRVSVEGVLIVAGLAVLAVQEHKISADGEIRFRALRELLRFGHLMDTPYSMIGPLAASPLVLLGKVLTGDTATFVKYFNLGVFVVGLLALYLLLRGRVDAMLLRRFLLLLVAGSMVAPHTMDFYGELVTLVGLGVGTVAGLTRGSRWLRRTGWAAAVLGAANTPASMIAAGLVSLERVHATRRLRYGLIAAAVVALIGLDNLVRRGNPLDNGYAASMNIARTVMPYSGREGFSYPLVLGVAAIVFSFGKGLIFFMPGLFLPLRGRLTGLYDPQRIDLDGIRRLWLLTVAGLVIVYATWWSWYGGMYWGPRFFLVGILPASLVLAAYLSVPRGLGADLVTAGVLILSVYVSANGLLFHDLYPPVCYVDNYALEALCHFTPEFSPLWQPFVVQPPLSPADLGAAAYYAVVGLWLGAPLAVRIVVALRGNIAAALPKLRGGFTW